MAGKISAEGSSSLHSEVYGTFEDMSLNEAIVTGIHAYGFENPSMNQQKGIVPFCKGRNVLQIAGYEPGNTTIFCVGILQQLEISKVKCQALVLVHNLTLAEEIGNEMLKLGKLLDVKVLVVGLLEESVDRVHVLVGRPYDVLKAMRQKLFDYGMVKILVLDEADKFHSLHLDMVYKIFKLLTLQDNDSFQVGVFSETMPEKVEDIASKLMKDPLKIEGKKPDELSVKSIEKHLFVRKENAENDGWKFQALHKLYEEMGNGQKIIVFVDTYNRIEELRKKMENEYQHKFLAACKFMDQSARNKMKEEFLKIRVLIINEILARGIIDVEHVDLVVNFDLPRDYLRRVGQFKRVSVVNFVTNEDWHYLFDFQTDLGVVFEEHITSKSIMPLLIERDESIKHFVYNGANEDAKFDELVYFLGEKLGIVETVFFVDTCERVASLAKKLKKVLERECVATIIPYDENSQDLSLVFQDIYKSRVLIMTDVHADKTDVTKVSFVVHYNLPQTADVFNRRIAWCASNGSAMYIPTDRDWSLVFEIQRSCKVVLKWFPENLDTLFIRQTRVQLRDDNGEFMTFGSRVTTANQVIQALQDDKVSLLGIYGVAGVGKSTLISAPPTYLKMHKIFDEVVLVALTQNPEIKVIQGDIADGLGLKFEDAHTLGTRAHRLLARLSQPQKTLIVLDNVWQRIELTEVGIPLGLNNCKVVFTTRDINVCNRMDAGESRIEVDRLSPDESWDLFQEKAGGGKDSLALPSFARDVSNECQGLPLLIVTLGRALNGKDQNVWKATLDSLKNPTFIRNNIFPDTPQVFYGIKLSYDFLDGEEVKFCFLLCCLFPDGYHISMDQLFHYMMGEKMLTKESTLQAARRHLHVIVDKLISSCLLLQVKNGCVMMHDVVRDVALAISSKDSGFVVEAGKVLNDWPDRQSLADCRRLSLMTIRGNRMNWSLPSQIQAAHLLTLSFHGNERIISIPAKFFDKTPSLLILDLSYTGIKELPHSINFLASLRALLLEGCLCLKDVFLSDTLEKLEILSLRHSTIESFVVSSKVKNLKQLDLSYTSKLKWISQNIISSFVKLEELYLFDRFCAWESERTELGESPSKGKDHAEKDEPVGAGTRSSAGADRVEDYDRLSEVVLLRHLTSLEFHVGNLDSLPMDIPNWESLTRFKIAVGVIDDFSPFGISDGMLLEKSMYIELRSKLVSNWVKMLLGKTHFLQLKGSQNLNDLAQLDPSPEQQIFLELQVLVLSEIESRTSLIRCDMLVRLRNLKKLVVANCKYMQKLIDFEVEDQAVFQEASLNTVKFSSLPLSSAFPNLTYLRVCACAELRHLFPMRIFRLLQQLQMLHIGNCHKMKMVIGHENAEDVGNLDDEKAILSKLKILSLEGLKSLSLIIQQDVHLELPALEELTVNDCGGLKKLPFGPGSVPQLTKLVVDDDDWFDELIWDDQNVKQRLCCLLSILQLKGCGSLKDVELRDQWNPTLRSVRVTDYEGTTLIPCSFLRKMPHLKNLGIKNSRELEMIDIGEEDDTVEEEMLSAAPSSSSANTSKFSKSTPYPAAFGNLSCLRVSGCSAMKYLCPWRVIGGLLQLEKLYIDDCSEMEMVIKHENEDKMILPKLRILSLTRLWRLSCIVLESGHLELPALEELKVKGCEKLVYYLSNASDAPRLHTELKLKERRVDYSFDWGIFELDDPALIGSLRVDRYQGASIVQLRRMWNLEKLNIFNSVDLEAIIEFEGENKAGETSVSATSSSSGKNKDLSKLSSSLVFSNLTSLYVYECYKLRYVLPVAVVRNMAQLKTLHVRSCKSMKTIIEYENVEDGGDAVNDEGFLPKLERLTLRKLPKLSSFAGRDILFDWPSLTKIWVVNCRALKKLPLGPGSVPKLETCWLHPKEWSNELEWSDEQLKSRLHSLPRWKKS